ncbi:MAG: hypothetical protein CM1200mP16_11600 [Nitrospina sp.]|nr:MAG: hypothetical protein CM1200mP16_11600 [Nitrospina sp.]
MPLKCLLAAAIVNLKPDEPGPDVGFRCASENKPVSIKLGCRYQIRPKGLTF